jgi:hypothetical protein
VLVPLVALDGDALSAVNVSLARTLGVFAGVFLGLVLLQLDLPSTALVALLLVLSLAAGIVLRVKDGPLNNQVASPSCSCSMSAPRSGRRRSESRASGRPPLARGWPSRCLPSSGRPTRSARRVAESLGCGAGCRTTSSGLPTCSPTLTPRRPRLSSSLSGNVPSRRSGTSSSWNGVSGRCAGPRAGAPTRLAFAEERRRLTAAARQYRHLRTITRIVADASAQQPPLPAEELDHLRGRFRPDSHRERQPDPPAPDRPGHTARPATRVPSASRSSCVGWSTTSPRPEEPSIVATLRRCGSIG